MPVSIDEPTPHLGSVLRKWALPHPAGFIGARWLMLRGLGIVFFSAFYSYAFQVQGLIGPHGILPASNYLEAARNYFPSARRYLEIPSLFWLLGTSSVALHAVVALGLLASISLTINLMPRLSVLFCTLAFLSIISVSSVFASYQSDGMLLEAGFLSLFFAPSGPRPGLGQDQPSSRIARFLLVWEWLRIYFESGIVKLASGDPQWRDLTALDHYYENCPLPTVIGWYVQHLPHAFHALMAVATLVTELFLVWAALLPRNYRVALFGVVSALQVGIILTANYAFLNYLVLLLGVLLLDDVALRRAMARLRRRYRIQSRAQSTSARPWHPLLHRVQTPALAFLRRASRALRASPGLLGARRRSAALGTWVNVATLCLVFYATLLEFPGMGLAALPVGLAWPARVLEPFRFANAYGLFAVMTRARYEIEFQGTLDGEKYIAYPFRYKPQDPTRAPGIFAPYQPRFEWNLWFASLGSVQNNRWVLRAAAALLRSEPQVLRLFRFDPFQGRPPKSVRTVIYRYWMTDWHTFKQRGVYWRRELLGSYAPELGGGALAWPTDELSHAQ